MGDKQESGSGVGTWVAVATGEPELEGGIHFVEPVGGV